MSREPHDDGCRKANARLRELVPELRQIAGQILTPTSRSKKFFNDCADRIESLETRNRQLVQAMGEIQRVCNGEEQVADSDTEALQWIWHEIEALALLKEMGKE